MPDLQPQLDEANARIEQLQRRAAIDEQLIAHDAVDLEAARLLIEHQSPDADELPKAVQRLRETRPYLFRTRQQPTHRAMSARESPEPRDQARHAAQHAAATGNPRDLLRYLRLKRRE